MSDANVSPAVDRDQLILVVSRLFSAFFLFWVVDDIIELPRELFSVMHYFRESAQAGVSFFWVLRSSYTCGLYVMYLLANVLRIALWLLAAGWFYRCGPRIKEFFTAAVDSSWRESLGSPPK
jgi:hypothetical protein